MYIHWDNNECGHYSKLPLGVDNTHIDQMAAYSRCYHRDIQIVPPGQTNISDFFLNQFGWLLLDEWDGCVKPLLHAPVETSHVYPLGQQ